MQPNIEREWLQVYTESEVEEMRRQADAQEEVDTWGPETRVCLTARAYVPTPADLDAQAAADREQEEAERDYRDLARLALASGAGACHCGMAETLPDVPGGAVACPRVVGMPGPRRREEPRPAAGCLHGDRRFLLVLPQSW
jgi:hypothetical protein